MDEIKKIAIQNIELTSEERNLLSLGYKNLAGSRRVSWRILSSIEARETAKQNTDHVTRVQDYRKKMEQELGKICNDLLSLLENNLIPNSSAAESKVFFYKMKADYHRYMAEVLADTEKKSHSDKAFEAYEAALQEATTNLRPTNPTRLGMALNFSVFYFEILNQPEKACQLARQAFDEAIVEIDSVDEDTYKDSTLIMQLLRDNLSLWTSDIMSSQNNGEDDDEDDEDDE